MKASATRGRIVLGLTALAVTLGRLMSKDLLATVPPGQLLLLQLAGSCTFVWSAVVATGAWPRGRAALTAALLGAVQHGAAWFLVLGALSRLPAGLETLLETTESLVVMVLAVPSFGERPASARWPLVFGGAVGVALLTIPGTAGQLPDPSGLLMAAGTVALGAIDTLVSRRLVTATHPIAVAAAGQTGALFAVAIVAHLMETAAPVGLGKLDWATILASGVLLHGLATLLFNLSLRLSGAAGVALVFPLTAAGTALGGVIVFAEPVSPAKLLGTALLLGSLAAAQRGVPGDGPAPPASCGYRDSPRPLRSVTVP
ncbi:DMT family transporter [Novosphingobium sp.]|uniref:DMT family transporter n=1 Tax=Novosphingobium sp. TaxID=1874826 RepID=UPI0026034659|nr:DMT family transporter [Novosphingobium sp.]